MKDRNEIITQRQTDNISDVLDNGPGLRTTRSTWVIAKDTKAGYVKKGGLGAMGVGEMWVEIRPYHQNDPTFDDAPEQEYPGSPFG